MVGEKHKKWEISNKKSEIKLSNKGRMVKNKKIQDKAWILQSNPNKLSSEE